MGVSDFQPVVGLEVHAQLLTRSKIFCGCPTTFGAPPNQSTCPVCLGLPGVLPVLNRRVVAFTVRTGLALGCEVRKTSIWARKNYFYPDLPKGYQITQFDQPICEHGKLVFDSGGQERTVRILRIHMEEDAGKSTHEGGAESRVDLNRAGVPLMEIVSQPDLRSAEEAADYLRALREVLVYLEVNDGNLEEGSFRCDANVSVMPKGSETFGTRVELKNINSFRFVADAIDFEITRQVERIEAGGRVVQETRLWDPHAKETRAMRGKEEAHDYRYFPEPDLPPLVLEDGLVEEEAQSLPELPRAKRTRFQEQYGLPSEQAKVLCGERALAELFETCARSAKDPRKLANWLTGELLRLREETGTSLTALKFTPAQLVELLDQVESGAVSLRSAKAVFAETFRTGEPPSAIIAREGLAQVSDVAAIEAVVDEVLAAHPSEVEKFRAGKAQVRGFFVGQVMKRLKGKANPSVVNPLLEKKLKG